MAKGKISKASKCRLRLFGPFCIIFIIYFCFSLVYNIYTIYNLNIEKQKLENKYVELQEESEKLKTDIEKLNDKEYLANYARENYLYSKDGEYIIQLDSDNTSESIEKINVEIDKNYLIIGLSVFMLFVIIYILVKGKKKK